MLLIRIFLLLSFILYPASYSFSTILHVPSEYPTIQEGIDAAIGGDTVMVADGIYTGEGNRDIVFSNHSIVVMSENGPDSCIIDCNGTEVDSHRGFLITLPYTDRLIISGFTIMNGWFEIGGALYLSNNADIRITNNIIRNNIASNAGGGIYCDNAESDIIDNSIVNNQAGYYGGAIALINSSTNVSNNEIMGNSVDSSGFGGGIYCREFSYPIIYGNRIIENRAAAGGGIFTDEYASPFIGKNVIIGNQAISFSGGEGGGIYMGNHAFSNIFNNTLSMNLASDTSSMSNGRGGGIYFYDGWPKVKNTILWDNIAPEGSEIFIHSDSVSIRYSDVKNGWPGEGSIDADPLFRNIENLNFHLMSVECGDSLDSPCIDAGDTASFDLILDCDWGLGTERSDMGAYGGYNEKVGINTTVETPDPPKGIFISQNFPNPFNPSTAILLNIPGGSEEKQKVNLIIYDLRGRVVKILIDNQLHAGSHKFIWDGKNEDGQKVSSGIYFCTLKSRDVTTTKKMVLIE